MNMFDGYHDHYNETVRLTILKALAAEPDFRLNETMLQTVLEGFAFKRGRSYLRTQLRWLEAEAGAIKAREIGSVMVAELTETGLDHVERRQVLDGIRKPSPVRG